MRPHPANRPPETRGLPGFTWVWALVALLSAIAAPPPARADQDDPPDRVHVTDGPPYRGKVHTLVGASPASQYLTVQTLDGKFTMLRRDTLVAIEFKAGKARELPENPDAGMDLIVRRDGSFTSGRVYIIGPNDVVIEGAMLDRATVDTIVFRPVTSAAEPGKVEPCPKDRRLGGWITLEFERFYPGICKAKVEAVAWFPLVHWNFLDFPRPPWPLILEHMEAPELSFEIRLGECEDLPGDNETCSAPAAERASVSPMGVGTKAAHTGILDFSPTRPELSISFPRDVGVTSRYQCVRPGGGGTGGVGVRLSRVTIGPRWSDLVKEPFNIELFAHAEPAPCAIVNSDRPRDCGMRPDRYAVIPFSGEATVKAGPYAAPYVPEVEMRYAVCCGCGKKPNTPGD